MDGDAKQSTKGKVEVLAHLLLRRCIQERGPGCLLPPPVSARCPHTGNSEQGLVSGDQGATCPVLQPTPRSVSHSTSSPRT